MKKEMKKVPAIRFKGFTDDWEQRKLGELGSTFTGLSGKTKEDFGHGDARFVTYMNVYSNSIADLAMTERVEVDQTQNSVKYGDIFFTTSSETPNEVGMSSVWLGNTENTYLNSFCFGYRPEVKVNPYYMAYMLRSPNVRNKLIILAQGISRYNISKNRVMDIEVPTPDLSEQKEIGQYFFNLDHLITLHQRKSDQLKKLKAYFLQNLFPAKGEKVPKIRFKGFTGDWEQYKLSNIYGTIRNAFVGTASPYYVDKGHFYLESNNVKDGHINKNTQVYINDEFYFSQKDKWLHTGDIVMVQSGHVGHAAVIPESLDNIAAHALIMFQNQKIETNPYFLNTEYQTDASKKQIESITKGNTIKHILASDMKNFMVMVPSLPEQQAIATYFKNLDNLIAHNQRKLEALQTLKKFLLQNLFV